MKESGGQDQENNAKNRCHFVHTSFEAKSKVSHGKTKKFNFSWCLIINFANLIGHNSIKSNTNSRTLFFALS